ncbi:dnaJ homolog subfamily C member 21-like isoform X2 [Watersipora subatra]|uniref:dnaJ homolog subfamily C member 21-like isoform X2 n=1 Tax=Watersipora subatra TaxID=2589382 RepID=UPI00355BAD8C
MVMRCHYEVLGVERDADDDTIKKSYRKLALRLHPDKNLENVEQATQEFRVVQQAYDVLSDSQERAWYDKHREAILMGGMGQGEDYNDESIDVYAYFNSSCYSGFYDDDSGFYTVYRKVFERISDEDAVFLDGQSSECELPSFGDSLSKFDEIVGPFYGHWESYCTAKSYVWCEKWDTRQAPDRMTRRAMEQENRKLCEAKKKERNEEIRALVAFVKKRDKRVIAHKKYLEEKAEETSRFVKERRLRDKQETLRKMENYEETGWSSMSNLEEHLQALENNVSQEFRDPDLLCSNSEDDDEEEELSSLFCVACNKSFKTDRAFSNHEKSKKHKENVALIKEEMLADDEVLPSLSDDDESNVEATPSRLSKKQKKKRKQQQKFGMADDLDDGTPGDNACHTPDQRAGEACERLAGLELEEEGCSNGLHGKEPVDNMEQVQDDISEFIHISSSKSKKNKKKAATEDRGGQKDALPELACKVCHSLMPTRNKLFEHIKETGHAALKHAETPADNPKPVESKSKRKNKKS